MKYVYVGKEYQGDRFRDSCGKFAERGLCKWLEAIILTEQPYLADGVFIDNSDEEVQTLLKLCRFFSAVLRDDYPEPIPTTEWSLDFEGKHHGLIGTYLNFVRNIYNKKQD